MFHMTPRKIIINNFFFFTDEKDFEDFLIKYGPRLTLEQLLMPQTVTGCALYKGILNHIKYADRFYS